TLHISTLSLHDALPIFSTANRAGSVQSTSACAPPSLSPIASESIRDKMAIPAFSLFRESSCHPGATGRISAAAQFDDTAAAANRSEEHTSELQSPCNLV